MYTVKYLFNGFLNKLGLGLLLLLPVFFSACGSGGGDSSARTGDLKPHNVSISTKVATLGVSDKGAEELHITLYADFANGLINQEITDSAVWKSSDESTVKITKNGHAVAVKATPANNPTIVTATYQGKNYTSDVNVISATIDNITVAPFDVDDLSAHIGEQAHFRASATYLTTNNTQVGVEASGNVKWYSSNTNVAKVDHHGVVTAVSAGDTNISTTSQYITAKTAELVISNNVAFKVLASQIKSIYIDPIDISVAKGVKQPFIAKAIYDDNLTRVITTDASWSTDAPQTANIEINTGIATTNINAVVNDVAHISATYRGFNATKPATLKITNSIIQGLEIKLTGAGATTLSNPKGIPFQVLVTGTLSDNKKTPVTEGLRWNIGQANVIATPDVNGSIATVGTTTTGVDISASITDPSDATKTITSNTLKLVVTPAELQYFTITPSAPPDIKLAVGESIPFIAFGIYTDTIPGKGMGTPVTNLVTWKSSNNSVASFTGSTLTAISVPIDMAPIMIEATINSSPKLATPTVSAMVHVHAAKLVKINIDGSNNVKIPWGRNIDLTAHGIYSDTLAGGVGLPITQQLTWITSASGVAIADNLVLGRIKTIGKGTAVITAETSDGLTKSAPLTLIVDNPVIDKVDIQPAPEHTVVAGNPQQYAAVGTYSNGDTTANNPAQNFNTLVTWLLTGTPGPASATIDANGLVTTKTAETVMVSATANSNGIVSNSAKLIVTQATIKSFSVNCPATVVQGINLICTATATFTDGTTPNITASLAWSSSDTTLVNFAPATSGAIGTANTVGQNSILADQVIDIKAMFGTMTQVAPVKVTVLKPQLDGVYVNYPTFKIKNATSAYSGDQIQFTAGGWTTDGRLIDIAPSWLSTNPAVATIDPSGLASTLFVSKKSKTDIQVTGTLSGITKTNFYTLAVLPIPTPTITSATLNPTSRFVTLTWSAVLGANNYNIWEPLNGTSIKWIGNVTSTAPLAFLTSTPNSSALLPGESRNFYVNATNGGTLSVPIGQSNYSVPWLVTAAPDAPAAPTAVSSAAVAGATTGSATVSWSAVNGATSYVVIAIPLANGVPLGVSNSVILTPLSLPILPATLSVNVPLLTKGASYTFTVTARNVGGNSAASAASTPATIIP